MFDARSGIFRSPVASARTALLTLLLLMSPVLVGCGSNEAAESEEPEEETLITMGDPLADSTLAAIVSSDYGTDTLTTAEFRTQIERVMQQFPQIQGDADQARELRRSLVEQFALTHALEGEVEEGGLQADTAALEEQIAQVKARFGTEEEFQQALAEQDLSEEVFRESMREQIGQQNWQQNIVENTAEPTEAEIETYRDEQAEQVRAQHILFLSQGPDSSVEARAEAVLDTVKSGDVPFEELAQRHSDDGTAAQGGDLGYFSKDEMVEEFSDAAFALQDSGDVADSVIRTQFGYHIIRLLGRRTGELMEVEQAKQMMMRRRQQDAMMGALDRLREKVTVRINPEIVDADLNEPLE